MKSLLAVAACLLFAHTARGEGHTVRVQETAIIEIAGATAAYTTNPAIASRIRSIAAPIKKRFTQTHVVSSCRRG